MSPKKADRRLRAKTDSTLSELCKPTNALEPEEDVAGSEHSSCGGFAIVPEATLDEQLHHLIAGHGDAQRKRSMRNAILKPDSPMAVDRAAHDLDLIGRRSESLDARQDRGGLDKHSIIMSHHSGNRKGRGAK